MRQDFLCVTPNGEWAGYSYEWLEDLSDAILLPGGKSKILANGINWDYPSQTQCMECHTEVAGFTLGPEIAQINRQTIIHLQIEHPIK